MTQAAGPAPAVVNQPPTKPVKAGIGLRLAIDRAVFEYSRCCCSIPGCVQYRGRRSKVGRA